MAIVTTVAACGAYVAMHIPYALGRVQAFQAICRMFESNGFPCPGGTPVPSQIIGRFLAAAALEYLALALPPTILALAGRRRAFVMPALATIFAGAYLFGAEWTYERIGGWRPSFLGTQGRYTSYSWHEPVFTQHLLLGITIVAVLVLLPAGVLTRVSRSTRGGFADLLPSTSWLARSAAACGVILLAIVWVSEQRWAGSLWEVGGYLGGAAGILMFLFGLLLPRRRWWLASIPLAAFLATGWPAELALNRDSWTAATFIDAFLATAVLASAALVAVAIVPFAQMLERWSPRGRVLFDRTVAVASLGTVAVWGGLQMVAAGMRGYPVKVVAGFSVLAVASVAMALAVGHRKRLPRQVDRPL